MLRVSYPCALDLQISSTTEDCRCLNCKFLCCIALSTIVDEIVQMCHMQSEVLSEQMCLRNFILYLIGVMLPPCSQRRFVYIIVVISYCSWCVMIALLPDLNFRLLYNDPVSQIDHYLLSTSRLKFKSTDCIQPIFDYSCVGAWWFILTNKSNSIYLLGNKSLHFLGCLTLGEHSFILPVFLPRDHNNGIQPKSPF